MRGDVPTFRELGGELCVVGSGQPLHARDFIEQHGLDFPLLVDPRLEAYAAAGLRRDVASTLNPRVLGHAWRAMRAGHRQGKTRGDPWQQGGAFVISPDNRVWLEQVSRAAGDHVAPASLVEALRAARGRG